MANENSANTSSHSPRRVFFGDNEGAALSFADMHWHRVLCIGYVTESVKEGEPAGWVVSYAQKDTEISLHPLSDSFEAPVAVSKVRSKTARITG